MMGTVMKSGFDGFATPIVLGTSSTYYHGTDTPARWWDFAAASVDGFDNSFWVGHELATGTLNNEWTTQWANLVLPDSGGWVADGATIRTGYTHVESAQVVADGQGGAFIVWL